MARRLSSVVVVGLTIFFLFLNWGWLRDGFLHVSRDSAERVTISPGIPKKIWQASLSPRTRDATREISARWRTLNPGYEYTRLIAAESDAEIRNHLPPAFGDLYSSLKNTVLRASLLRYLLLLVEGGIWVDLDVLPRDLLSTWVPDEYIRDVGLVVALADNMSESEIQFSTSVIMSEAPHIVVGEMVTAMTSTIRAALENRNWMLSDKDELTLIMETGPKLFTSKVLNYLRKVAGEDDLDWKLRQLREPTLIGDVLVLPQGSLSKEVDKHMQGQGGPRILAQRVHAELESGRELLRGRQVQS